MLTSSCFTSQEISIDNLTNKADKFYKKNKFKKALECYNNLFDQEQLYIEDTLKLLKILDNAIYCDYRLDNYENGIKKCEKALIICKSDIYPKIKESILKRLSWINYELGYDYANKAVFQDNLNNITNYAKSIEFFKKSDSILDQGYVLTDYSAALCLNGMNNQSVSLLKEYINLNLDKIDNDLLFNLKTNLGIAYYNIGNFKKSMKIQEEINDLIIKIDSDEETLSIYKLMNTINLNNSLDKLGRYKESIKNGEQALTTSKKLGSYDNFIERNLSKSYFLDNQLDLSLFHIENVKNRLENNNKDEINNYNIGFIYKDLAAINFKKENYKNAIVNLEKAISLQNNFERKDYISADNLRLLSKAYFKIGNTSLSKEYLERSINQTKSLIQQDEKFLTPKNNLYYQRKLLRDIYKLYNLNINYGEEFDLTSWFYIKNRDLSINNSISELIKTSSKDNVKNNYLKLLNLKNEYFEIIQSGFLSQNQNDKLMILDDEINKIEIELLKELNFKNENIGLTKNKIDSSLKTNEVFIDFMKLPYLDSSFELTKKSKYFAFIFQRGQKTQKIYLGDSKAIENIGYQIHKRNITYKRDMKSNSSYEILFNKIDSLVGIDKSLVIYPDGIYNMINLYALYNENKEKYVFEYRDITLINDYRDINSDPENFSISKSDTVNIFSNPDFSINEETEINNFEIIENSRTFRGGKISSLPGTIKEASVIEELFTNYGVYVKSYSKSEATEERIKELYNSNITHIATHGYYLSKEQFQNLFEINEIGDVNPYLLSGLLMSGAENNISKLNVKNNGWLSSLEIQSCDFRNTKLIVLSACETLIGSTEIGRGVFGLNQALKNAGAQNIISSLWKVDDESTKDFMINFYNELLKSNDIGTSLKFAMKKTKIKYSHPYYWAPFIHIE